MKQFNFSNVLVWCIVPIVFGKMLIGSGMFVSFKVSLDFKKSLKMCQNWSGHMCSEI